MRFEIYSHEGAGPIRFGMTPSDVRAAIGAAYESFKRTPQSAHPCDYFPDLQCFVYYNRNGKAEAAEFAEPGEPTLGGVNLLSLGFADLVARVTVSDPNVSVEGDGFTSLHLGIGAYAPSAEDEPTAPPESVIVFARGYYD
jgi:hypothetical protein